MTRAPAADASLQRAIELGATRIGAGHRPAGSMRCVRPPARRTLYRARLRFRAEPAGALAPRRGRSRRRRCGGRGRGGAFRLSPLPAPGDLIELRSGIVGGERKDAAPGALAVRSRNRQAWASMEAVALTFDTTTRKTIALSPEARAQLQSKWLRWRYERKSTARPACAPYGQAESRHGPGRRGYLF